jgi:hypothetical protein
MTANVQSLAEGPADNVVPVKRVLPKPFDIGELVAHVRECCED